jgi:RHS repeat-associated protein
MRTLEEFAIARGDSLDEVYDFHTSSSMANGPTGTFPDPMASANPVADTSGSSSGSVLPVHNATGLDSTRGSQANLGFSEQHDSLHSLRSSIEANSDWDLPTDFGFTGQRWDQSTGLYDYRSRFYDPKLGRFIGPDPIVPNLGNPQDLNRYAYCRNNPLRYKDPDGHTARSALDLIREYRSDINSIAEQYSLDPVLLAGIIFAENRNDYNWIRGQDWSSGFTLRLFGGPEVKNVISPLVKDNASIGITEVSVAVAAMMGNPELVPDNYADLSWEERSELHAQIATDLSQDERQSILDNLSDPQMALEYTAQYLNFLAGYRDYGEDYALWMSDYNRGLSDWDTTTEYGRRIDVYRENIEHSLNWEPTDWICVGRYGCGVAYDRQIYGELP